jgi:hypothetical protein
LLLVSLFYAGFGYLAAAVSNGMKDANGPALAVVFIISILALDFVLIKRRFELSQINWANLASILTFYLFSIAMPLWRTCATPVSAIIALIIFSLVTFLPFAVIIYLMRGVLIKKTV